MTHIAARGALAVTAALLAPAALAADPVPRLAVLPVATGLTRPVFVTAPPGDRERLFIVELSRDFGPNPVLADVKILNLRTGQLSPQPFATVPVSAGGERGLLGMAFHPAYATNGYFYLHHSSHNPSGSRIVRYRVSSSDPNRFDPATETEIFFAAQSAPNHQSGWIAFGRDGFLYFAIGDVAQPANSQTLLSPFGKILRIDISAHPYAIPPTNPYFGSLSARQEIWALGLRNPWRNSFDRLTGDLWIADVGSGGTAGREEVNFQPATAPPFAARNYGWPTYEGPCPTPCNAPSHFVFPIHWFPTSQNYYIAGGYVYRGAAIPELRGAYFFSGAGNTRVWSLRYDGQQVYDHLDHTAELQPPPPLAPLNTIVSFGEDAAGELYMTSFTPGIVYRIIPRCWANCDGSTTQPALNVDDFMCFIARFATGDPYANCDASTTPPVLNIDDFTCFINQFAVGCP